MKIKNQSFLTTLVFVSMYLELYVDNPEEVIPIGKKVSKYVGGEEGSQFVMEYEGLAIVLAVLFEGVWGSKIKGREKRKQIATFVRDAVVKGIFPVPYEYDLESPYFEFNAEGMSGVIFAHSIKQAALKLEGELGIAEDLFNLKMEDKKLDYRVSYYPDADALTEVTLGDLIHRGYDLDTLIKLK